ncbi:pilus assembly protein TadG-related protein [Novosphingobium tardum]|uniref:Pilus assembly protein TadG-related protein n=1 Tax=Novosphingobium tardum TaxID=1538021 RepID=A0ABV8RKV0_9SPHN
MIMPSTPNGSRFVADERGAVAATYALALTALVAIAGVGFDYGRMVALDTELQNGADQAALAAATQLDRQAGACQRAAAAASGLVNNLTIMANDGGDNQVVVPNESTCDGTGQIRFFVDKAKTTAATTDADAHFVEVVVNARTARYALTPIVGAITSGSMNAAAFAGVGNAICRVPPVMMCNPEEPAGNVNTQLQFDADNRQGVGIRLLANDSYTPGSFGYLNTGANGANALAAAVGWDVRPGDCIGTDGVELKTGVTASVIDAFNTRFDMPGSGGSCPNYGGVNGVCSPSVNVRKGLVRNSNNCNSNAWGENASNFATAQTRNYRPTTRDPYPAGTAPDIMGHPRDLCHAWSNDGDCSAVNGGKNGRVGTGDWDINAYWRSNYGTAYANEVPLSYGAQPKGYPTRYEVYRWEADKIVAGTLSGIIKDGQGNTKAYAQPQAGMCLATAASPYGIPPGGLNVDRRRISAAVLNCNALSAKYGSINNKTLETAGWADMFLVEPSISRNNCTTGNGCNVKYSDTTDVYVEIIGKTKIGGDGSIGQTVRRDVPYLIE